MLIMVNMVERNEPSIRESVFMHIICERNQNAPIESRKKNNAPAYSTR
jgi:hypothetical protein